MQQSPSAVDPTYGGISAARPSSAKSNLHLARNPMAGKRIGEAARPGPQTTLTSLGWGQSQSLGKPCPGQAPSAADSVVVAVANPTAIWRKVPQVLQMKADIVCLAETSAVLTVENQTSKQFQLQGWKAHLGSASS